MTHEPHAVGLEQVLDRELAEIVNRRRETGLLPVETEVEDNQIRDQVGRELVGLSLSGGGNRSASFNLGLIQSLHKNRFLRLVDYLSTVSGGGYIGACLSSLVLHPDVSLYGNGNHAPNGPAARHHPHAPRGDPDGRAARDAEHFGFPLAPESDDRQPPRVEQLVHGGAYLSRPLLFLNRYLIGAFLINVVTLSGVIALAAITAWAFRGLDHPVAIDWLYALGFRGDVQRAFFPAAVCFGLWVITWAISYWRRGAHAPGRIARWFLAMTIISVLLAMAALLVTGDIDFTYLKETYGFTPPREVVRESSSALQRMLLVFLIIALLPYLRVQDLIRSGTKPRNVMEGWIFAIASRALVYGLPLLIFALLARENLSGFNEKRVQKVAGVELSTQYNFVPLEFRDWSETWNLIKLQAAGYTRLHEEDQKDDPFGISMRIWDKASPSPASGSTREASVEDSLLTLQESVSIDTALSFWERWLLLLTSPIPHQDNQLIRLARSRIHYREQTTDICDRLSKSILSDQDFHQFVRNSKIDYLNLPKDHREALESQLRSLVAEAERLHDKIEGREFSTWKAEKDELVARIAAANLQPGTSGYKAFQEQLKAHMARGSGEFAWVESELARINWSMIKAFYGNQLCDKSTVFARVVLDSDQHERLATAAWAAVLFLLSACIVNFNATAMHGYYRNRLAEMWLTHLPGMGRTIPLARLETTAKGAPYHLINATVMLFGRRRETSKPPTDVFLFSRGYCGSEQTGFVSTENYGDGTYDLANAVALSGAAVTPTQVQNPLLALLLLLSNSRLGQWLPNPAHIRWLPAPFQKALDRIGPVPLRLLVGMFRTAEARDLCFVSDGGHYENLGLEQLLLRRCRVILVSDATCDPDSTFKYFMEVVRRSRSLRGIQFRGFEQPEENLGMGRISPDPNTGLSLAHFFIARIEYPTSAGPKEEGLLIFLKPTFTGDEDADLLHYRAESGTFPHDPTSDQFYNADKFESYRQLGFHTGERLGTELPRLLQAHPNLPLGEPIRGWAEEATRATAEPPPRANGSHRKRTVVPH